MHTCGMLVSRGQRRHYGLKIGRTGHLELRLCMERSNEGERGKKCEENSAHKATVV